MDLKLAGKKVLVMGASTGLGRAIAQVLVQEGAMSASVPAVTRNCKRQQKK